MSLVRITTGNIIGEIAAPKAAVIPFWKSAQHGVGCKFKESLSNTYGRSYVITYLEVVAACVRRVQQSP